MMIATLLLAVAIAKVNGHITMEEPPARNVMWRMGFKDEVPPNPNDDYLICQESGGAKCPPCGDDVGPPPYPHQAGGYFMKGIIVETYSAGQTIDVTANVTIAHAGYIDFNLCPNNDMKKAVTQRCLDKYPLEIVGSRDAKAYISVPDNAREMVRLQLQLPSDLECDQCVLQMTYHAEQFLPNIVMFRNCADIAITGGRSRSSASRSSASNNRQRSNPRFHF